MKTKKLYTVLVIGSAIGLVASLLELLYKIALLKTNTPVLACTIPKVFSCHTALNAWQSSAFGFPNSIIAIVFFSITLGIGLVGLVSRRGSNVVTKDLRLVMQAISLLFLGFTFWYLAQSFFSIRSFCAYYLIGFAGLILVNDAWLREDVSQLPISRRDRKYLRHYIVKGADILGCLLIVVAVIYIILLRHRCP
jgi:uncharacterized membrane protein